MEALRTACWQWGEVSCRRAFAAVQWGRQPAAWSTPCLSVSGPTSS